MYRITVVSPGASGTRRRTRRGSTRCTPTSPPRSSAGCPTRPGSTPATAGTPPWARSGRTWRSGAPAAGKGDASASGYESGSARGQAPAHSRRPLASRCCLVKGAVCKKTALRRRTGEVPLTPALAPTSIKTTALRRNRNHHENRAHQQRHNHHPPSGHKKDSPAGLITKPMSPRFQGNPAANSSYASGGGGRQRVTCDLVG